MLWPDTFNNHFHTDVGVACVEAIEAAGWQVVMPEGHVCCGRPLYDYGFLDLAAVYLRRTLETLRSEIRAGTPIVGMEPSCLAVFKDELTGMLPHDDDAKRLARNAMHFAEFFEHHDLDVPTLERWRWSGDTVITRPPAGWTPRRAAEADGNRRHASQGRLLRPGRVLGL